MSAPLSRHHAYTAPTVQFIAVKRSWLGCACMADLPSARICANRPPIQYGSTTLVQLYIIIYTSTCSERDRSTVGPVEDKGARA